jgi:hypothetical protein
VATAHELPVRRRQSEWVALLHAAVAFGRPLLTHWRVTVAIVVLSVGAALVFSRGVGTRYEAVAHFTLTRTEPGARIQQTLNGRLRSASAALGLELRDTDVRFLARPGDHVVGVVVSAPENLDLASTANQYAAEMTAWELGPRARRTQARIRQLFDRLDVLAPASAQHRRVEAELDRLLPVSVSDAQYSAASSATRTHGPEFLRSGAVAFAVGLVLALAIARVLEGDGRRRAAVD